MRKYGCIGSLFLLLMLTACQKDLPEPETKEFASHHNEAIQASGLVMSAGKNLLVKHQVKGNDVYVECIVKGASFRNDGTKLILYIDGKKTKEVNNAAFILKGLNQGSHKIKLDLIIKDINTASCNRRI